MEFAPAKINLALHITGRRADGYHLLESLAVFTRFGDRIELGPDEQDSLTVSGTYAPGVPADETNLVLKARDALRAAAPGMATPPVAIRLEKNLPMASGIGGGSSDAAATLRALVRFWNLDIGHDALLRIGAALGADLPMCLAARPLVARGAGEDLSTVDGFPPLGLVLVNPGVGIATPAVFAALSQRENASLPPLPRHFDFHTIRNWLETTRNDLEGPAQSIEPSVGAARAALERAGAGFARMSGSGATCFGLFETGNVAKRAAAAIRSRHPGWFVAATRSTPSGDAHGQA
ncbi:4-(cytidine 5'-diphospho)-2-C-methyl-D-erythritol kinase [Mesorhizobium marinum]|uniref:4-(cytidine 5'-diphospho)-2-C-methyl-D-erythritol kinase n=1 Tax=Mesorhizobium marinum TaxID=3228790 RepID=UPI003465030E